MFFRESETCLTHSTASRPAFEGRVKKLRFLRQTQDTERSRSARPLLRLRPELRPRGTPGPSVRGRKGLTFLLLICLIVFRSFVNEAGAMTIEEEKKLGKTVYLEIERSVEFVKDPTLQGFLERMGHSLVSQLGPTPFEFRFYLIKIPDPNAFAVPGGYIFVTTGLLTLAESEHEVAGVLSHEISHVTERHVAETIERSKRINLATLAAMIAGAVLGGVGGGGEVAGATTMMSMALGEAQLLKYTRENEVDADQNSLQVMLKAGYDPNGLISFLTKMYKVGLAASPKIPPYLSTHPVTENRISLLENLIQIRGKPSGPFRSIGNFKRIQMKTFVEEREAHVSVTHFQSMIDTHPQDVNGYYGLGLAYRKMGRLDKATEVFQKGAFLAPSDPDLLNELGITYFLSGKLDLAIGSLEAVSSLSRTGSFEDLSSLYYLGRAYQEKGEMAKALPLLLKVKKEMPELSDIDYHLGSIYGRMGQKGLSHLYFGKYFKLRGESNNALNHFRKAAEFLEKGSLEMQEAQREVKELTGGK